MTKRYVIEVPFHAWEKGYVDAETEEEALQKFKEDGPDDWYEHGHATYGIEYADTEYGEAVVFEAIDLGNEKLRAFLHTEKELQLELDFGLTKKENGAIL